MNEAFFKRHNIELNGTQHNDTQQKGLIWDTQHKQHSEKQHTVLRGIMLSGIILSVTIYLLFCWMLLCWLPLCWMSSWCVVAPFLILLAWTAKQGDQIGWFFANWATFESWLWFLRIKISQKKWWHFCLNIFFTFPPK